MAPAFEQRNPYKGVPPRPWVRLRFAAPTGVQMELDLFADTGSPFAVIVSHQTMLQLNVGGGPVVSTNFGTLHGGWLELATPELGLTSLVLGYAGDAVVAAAKNSSPDFEG